MVLVPPRGLTEVTAMVLISAVRRAWSRLAAMRKRYSEETSSVTSSRLKSTPMGGRPRVRSMSSGVKTRMSKVSRATAAASARQKQSGKSTSRSELALLESGPSGVTAGEKRYTEPGELFSMRMFAMRSRSSFMRAFMRAMSEVISAAAWNFGVASDEASVASAIWFSMPDS